MDRIYLDNAATTAVSQPVMEAMLPYYMQVYGNPSSIHSTGRDAKKAVERARRQVASALGCSAQEIYFTAGGSESDNWALKGAAFAHQEKGKHIITTQIEHHAILHTCQWLEAQGWRVTYLPVDADGFVTAQQVENALRPDTVLVSVMAANNEIGTLEPVAEIGALCHERGVLFHTDAVQAVGAIPLDVEALHADMLSLSAHKFHGPKGIGALYLSDRLVQAFQPPYLGGEQERGLRPGTENLPYAMGLAAAAARLAKTMKSRDTAMRALNQRLRDGLAAFPEVVLNSPADAVPEVLNFSENCIKSETMLAFLAEAQIYVSSASACGRGQPSHTLAAMGRDPLAIDTAIRVSFCADNTPEDVDAFLNRFEDGMKHLQRIKK